MIEILLEFHDFKHVLALRIADKFGLPRQSIVIV